MNYKNKKTKNSNNEKGKINIIRRINNYNHSAAYLGGVKGVFTSPRDFLMTFFFMIFRICGKEFISFNI